MNTVASLLIMLPLRIAFGLYSNLKPSRFTLLYSLLYFTSGVYVFQQLSSDPILPLLFSIAVSCYLRYSLIPLFLISAAVHMVLWSLVGLNPWFAIMTSYVIYIIKDSHAH